MLLIEPSGEASQEPLQKKDLHNHDHFVKSVRHQINLEI